MGEYIRLQNKTGEKEMKLTFQPLHFFAAHRAAKERGVAGPASEAPQRGVAEDGWRSPAKPGMTAGLKRGGFLPRRVIPPGARPRRSRRMRRRRPGFSVLLEKKSMSMQSGRKVDHRQ